MNQQQFNDSPLRAAFAARFGEDNAEAVEAAAAEHYGEWVDRSDGMKSGSDYFRTLLCFAIGFECLDLAHHDGDLDHLALMTGAYDDWMITDGVS